MSIISCGNPDCTNHPGKNKKGILRVYCSRECQLKHQKSYRNTTIIDQREKERKQKLYSKIAQDLKAGEAWHTIARNYRVSFFVITIVREQMRDGLY